MKGEGNKLRLIRYGPFTILEKIGDNAFCLDFLAYMQMYLVVNIEKLKLCEPPLIMDIEEVRKVPTVDDFAHEYLENLPEDIILYRKTKTSRQGYLEYLCIGFKEMHPNKACCMEKEKVREQFPHFPIE